MKARVWQAYLALKKNIGEVIFKANDVVNDGERFEPFLTSFSYKDTCHIPRYLFASKYITDKDVVLDIACGTGYGSAILSQRCLKITGVDISAKAIAYAMKKNLRHNTEYLVSDFFGYNGIADTVVSFETIEHIHNDNIDEILSKLISYSKKTVIGSIPYKEPVGNNPYHYLFNLDESNINCLANRGEISFFYQSPDGTIHDEKPEQSIQNLIFIFNRHLSTADFQ